MNPERSVGLRSTLDQQFLDFLLDGRDLWLELGSFVGCNTASDDRARDATGTAEGLLGANEDVWHVLVFAQQWQMQQDLQRLCVSCHDDELRQSTVESFGGLVGTASQLLVVHSLLDQRHDLGGEC